MSKLASLAGVVALTAVALTAPTAQAAEPRPAESRALTAAAADGKLHAWTEPYRGGAHCAWSGSRWEPADSGERRRAAPYQRAALAGARCMAPFPASTSTSTASASPGTAARST